MAWQRVGTSSENVGVAACLLPGKGSRAVMLSPPGGPDSDSHCCGGTRAAPGPGASDAPEGWPSEPALPACRLGARTPSSRGSSLLAVCSLPLVTHRGPGLVSNGCLSASCLPLTAQSVGLAALMALVMAVITPRASSSPASLAATRHVVLDGVLRAA